MGRVEDARFACHKYRSAHNHAVGRSLLDGCPTPQGQTGRAIRRICLVNGRTPLKAFNQPPLDWRGSSRPFVEKVERCARGLFGVDPSPSRDGSVIHRPFAFESKSTGIVKIEPCTQHKCWYMRRIMEGLKYTRWDGGTSIQVQVSPHV